EEPGEHLRPVDLRKVVLVHGIQRAEARPHPTQPRRGPQRQREQRDVGLLDRDLEVAAASLTRRRRLLAGGDADDRGRIGVDAAEEADRYLAREEPVLAAGKRAVAVSLALGRREVGDEVAADADVEEQGAAGLRERERLARRQYLRERGRVGAGRR